MGARFTELHCKEVVCVSDGRRLGFIQDVIIEMPKGEVNAIVVPGKGRCLGFLSPREDYVIPWRSICRVGPDIVLVDVQPDSCRCLRGKPRFLF